MFPLLPSNFLFPPTPTPLNLSASVSNVSQANCANRVIANSDISAGACSEEFSYEILFSGKNPSAIKMPAKIYQNENGELRSDGCDTFQWILNLPLSSDCHSNNVILQETRNEKCMVLRAVKPIKQNENLELWFSDRLLAIMQIPFLTPQNIQGDKLYVCHFCGRRFEVPNPLKIHLALDCGRLDESRLWKRLEQLNDPGLKHCVRMTPSSYLSETPVQLLRFQVSLSTDFRSGSNGENTADNIRLRNVSPMEEKTETTPAKLSAFKPYSERSAVISGVRSPLVVPHVPFNYLLLRHSLSQNDFALSDNIAVQRHTPHCSQKNAMELEALVSNLGKSKQGHLCIYCGKIYSRKYGLKIHIRTHTGYKPLKCKFCLRPFGDPSNLNKHVRLHAEGATPYKCEFCGKILVRRRDLDRHIKSRHSVTRNQQAYPGICSPSATVISNSSL